MSKYFFSDQKQFKLTIALGTKCELYDVIQISPSINDKSQASNEGILIKLFFFVIFLAKINVSYSKN